MSKADKIFDSWSIHREAESERDRKRKCRSNTKSCAWIGSKSLTFDWFKHGQHSNWHVPWVLNWIRQLRRVAAATVRHPPEPSYRHSNRFWCAHPIDEDTSARGKYAAIVLAPIANVQVKYDGMRIITCAIRMAERRPDWIWPKWTTPVTPTSSSIPSQWFGFEKWSSFSMPHGFAPLPQL